MTDDHELERKPGGPIWPVAVILAVLYVISIGPVAWVCWQFGDVDFSYGSTFGMVYWPLIWLAEEVPWFGVCLDTYVFWFLR